jgi:ABC-2 type transport system ATP-binding protein
MIEVEALTKRFGVTLALDDVSVSAEAGRVLALLGPNGAGKTTLVRVLTTLLVPDAGRARVAGLDVTQDAKAIRSIIGLAGQYATVDEMLTGRENLELVGLLYHLDKAVYRRRAADALERMSLAAAGDRPVRTYSGGMRRRLDLAASLIGRPPVLFLDEPTTGLDPRTRNDLWQLIEELVADGTTVLLTTQYMEEAEHLEKAASLVAGLGSAAPRLDPELNKISVPVKGGPRELIAAGRVLDDSGMPLEDLGIRRPSLDDVFLALTGHATGPGGGETTTRAGAEDD